MGFPNKTDIRWAREPLIYRVIYGDTDKAGVVYYANYLRFFEMGRTEWMRKELGIPYKGLEDEGVLFPVVETYIRYKAPALYDDMIEIHTGLGEVKKVSICFYYEIKRDGRVLVSGFTKHGATDLKGKLTKIPERIFNRLSINH